MYFQLSPILERWGVRLGLAGVVVGGAIAFGSSTLAQAVPDSQIVPDNTLGADNNSRVSSSPNGLDTLSGGATQGSNLFHSFDSFSIPNGRVALFDNGANIQNILTRVTGGSRSDIDGIIATLRGTPNLFLLNPNGIIFGENARLLIGGSFIATTARSINFADGTQFSATPGAGAPLLTVSVPLGLQFGTNPGQIFNRASGGGLQVGTGRTLGLIGGNVNLEGGRLTARGGRIELGAVAAPGVVGVNPDNSGFRFSFPTDLALGDISLTNSAEADVRAGGGGSIGVNARNLKISGSSLLTAGIGTNVGSTGAQAGNIDINTQETVTIDGTITPDGVSGIRNIVLGIGNSGNIFINTDSLNLSGNAQISSVTLGQGDAGSVNITARDRVTITGAGSGFLSAVAPTAVGDGSDINIHTGSLSLSNRALISTSTLGQGNAGNIEVQAQNSVVLDNSFFLSNIGSFEEKPAVGDVGDIHVKAKTVSLTGGAQIQAGFFSNGQGNPGIVSIEADDSISIVGRNSNNPNIRSGILTNAEFGAVGNGSDIKVSAPLISLSDGAQLVTSNAGRGNAGNIEVQAQNSVVLDNSFFLSNIGSFEEKPAVGDVGDIHVKAKTVSLTGGAQIQAGFFSNGQGNPGIVSIEANDSISIVGRNSNNPNIRSGILTNAEFGAIGNASDIKISAPLISLTDGAVLNASNDGQGNGGNIELQASKSVRLLNGSRISTSAGGAGQPGNGGNITINSPIVIASFRGNSDIFANAFDGNGGRIEINAQGIFGLTRINGEALQSLLGTDTPAIGDFEKVLNQLNSNDSNDVAAFSITNPSLSGTVSFNAADIDPSRDVVELPTTPVDASTLVASGCPSGAENRFVVAGRGGLPPAPGDKLSADALLTDWATLTTPETQNRATVEQTIPEAANTTTTPLVEATTWQFGSKGEIILTNADPAAPNSFEATPSNCPSS